VGGGAILNDETKATLGLNKEGARTSLQRARDSWGPVGRAEGRPRKKTRKKRGGANGFNEEELEKGNRRGPQKLLDSVTITFPNKYYVVNVLWEDAGKGGPVRKRPEVITTIQ